MGIFINKSDHPSVFQKNDEIEEPNQSYFQTDYFSELIKEQQKLNQSLTKSLDVIKERHRKFEYQEAAKWKDVQMKLYELQRSSAKHEEFEHNVREWLVMLESNNQKLQGYMEENDATKAEMLDQIDHVRQSNQEIHSHLDNYQIAYKDLANQLQEVFELQEKLTEQLSQNNEKQDQLLNRYENQEALLEKTFRQIDHIRSSLFERTTFIAEKIENSYKLTSSLMYKLITGSEKPLTLLMTGKNREGKQENSD
ncbi:hypothetical protein SAMN05216389_11439 [Oceanobacillus limi]|uniref:Uncharacterized protein n=1 Tax=Oceanobacillus limi TaxID=930131 RepID=A0A1I0F805_9BACI|nr:hypothetical protein [Oceanobacillus limi]SET53869.1 hypothetical protein SAMN05216389_11439 [Oceanobacillus limi]